MKQLTILLLVISGSVLIGIHANIWVVIGIFLLLISHHIDQHTPRQKKIKGQSRETFTLDDASFKKSPGAQMKNIVKKLTDLY